MNLYGAISSERATKGQGGKWLDIQITNSKKEKFARLFVHEDGEIELSNGSGVCVYKANAVIFSEAKDEEKGEQQKGEVCEDCQVMRVIKSRNCWRHE